MNLARVDAFLAWSNLRVRSAVLFWTIVRPCPTMSHTIITKHISLDAVFHAASNENVFKPLWQGKQIKKAEFIEKLNVLSLYIEKRVF
jgi:hypothetical protein